MDALNAEINNLIVRLDGLSPVAGSVEAIALEHLKRIQSAASDAVGPKHLSGLYEALHQFWASTVPWCSELSRDLEKVIIMYRDLPQ